MDGLRSGQTRPKAGWENTKLADETGCSSANSRRLTGRASPVTALTRRCFRVQRPCCRFGKFTNSNNGVGHNATLFRNVVTEQLVALSKIQLSVGHNGMRPTGAVAASGHFERAEFFKAFGGGFG